MKPEFLPMDYLRSLLAMPDVWVKRYVLASWAAFAGAVFPEWRYESHIWREAIPLNDAVIRAAADNELPPNHARSISVCSPGEADDYIVTSGRLPRSAQFAPGAGSWQSTSPDGCSEGLATHDPTMESGESPIGPAKKS